MTVGMLTVVLTFALTLGYSQFLLRPIDDHALEIVRDAVPGMQHLSHLRSELAQLSMSVSEYVAGPAKRAQSRENLQNARAAIARELHDYRDLRASPRELEWLPAIDRGLALLDESADNILAAVDAGNSMLANRLLDSEFSVRQEQASAAMAQLQLLNEAAARGNADSILATRAHVLRTAGLLGLTSLTVAIATTVLVLLVLRSRANLLREHLRLVAARGAELEAFAGRIAHDLKDPLHAATLQLLVAMRQPDLQPALRQHFDAIGRQIEHINGLIAALLNFARAGAAASDGPAPLAQVLESVLASLQPRIEAAQIVLHVAAVPPVSLACSPGALGSVLANLIGNAVKYVVDGLEQPRQVGIRFVTSTHGCRVEIEDNGPGVPGGAQERIFEPFHRVRGNRHPGIGLGLATARKIVEAYGGHIGVRSAVERGSVFWFELPRAQATLLAHTSITEATVA